ncbi:hypothetical protein Ancab_004631 [Ancistrocladus abbreviatus]
MATYLSKGKEMAATITPAANGDNAGVKPYPAAEAKYEQVVENASVFMDKLRAFHSSFGTKLSSPSISGRVLDLHRLFVEVTSHGGLGKVVRDRKWKEVISTLNIPPRITNASFILRKYYLSLLYHFEQVYYFQKIVPTSSIAAPLSQSTVRPAVQDEYGVSATSSHLQESSTLPPGISLVGIIKEKTESGYLVSVDLGSEEFKGVLYHIPNASQSYSYAENYVIPKRQRRKSRLALQDPSRPKPNRSGYTFFFAEQYARLKPSHRGKERAIGKQIGLLWSQLSEAEKQVYQDQGVRDKERYRAEMDEYRAFHNR